ncbi:hypothetical protein LCGC14_2527930 [marine sediment metagenome]|uniref:Uncharacterized protein n=1 Tax=marine sediment metagenome TaxID=412755 RepID=A0A0F9BHD6_9ZZZZ
MAATVVWCQSCKTVVWAYDSMQPNQDIRGLMNMISMPCPKCGEVRNFDGWDSGNQTLEDVGKTIPGAQIYDWWSALKAVARDNIPDVKWEISPDCSWFKRPDSEMLSDEFPSDLTPDISELIKERYNNNLNIKAVEELMEKET